MLLFMWEFMSVRCEVTKINRLIAASQVLKMYQRSLDMPRGAVETEKIKEKPVESDS